MKFNKVYAMFVLLFCLYPFVACCQKTNTISISQAPLPKSNIYWLGESHGTSVNYDIAYDLFSKIDSAVKVDYILLESNYLQTYYLNKYMNSGDTNMLNIAFSTTVGTFGWTKEHKAYYERIYSHEQTKPKDHRIQFVGIDIEHSYWNTHHYLINYLLPSKISDSNKVISQIRKPLYNSSDFLKYYSSLLVDISQNESVYKSIFGDRFELLKYLIRNIYNITYCQSLPAKLWNKTRDSLIYENFKWHDEHLHFAKKVSFGLWGTDHIFQSTTKEGITFIAGHIKMRSPEISQTGYRMLYTKCSFNLPTFFIPHFVRWVFGKKKYIRTNALNNDKIWAKVSGVRYLKKRKNRNLSYPLHVDNISENINLLGNRKKGYQNSAYFQYILLVKKSPACTPLKKKF